MYVETLEHPSPAIEKPCRCHRGCAQCRPIAPVLLWKRQAVLAQWRYRHQGHEPRMLPDRECPICVGREAAA